MRYLLPTIDSEVSGFQRLGKLAETTGSLFADQLTLDMSRVRSFDAHMAAPLGTVLAHVTDRINFVEIVSVPTSIKRILWRNDFLPNYWYESHSNVRSTVLPFRRFRISDEGALEDYVSRALRHKTMVAVSPGAARAFKSKVFEIYQNAVIHSQSELGVFVCGHIVPRAGRLNFTVSDAGIGIRDAVRQHFGDDSISSVEAIKWALRRHHTTKRGPQPGGLGFEFLHEFARQNGGAFRIASRSGFYSFSSDESSFRQMSADFPGTAVTIEINITGEIQ